MEGDDHIRTHLIGGGGRDGCGNGQIIKREEVLEEVKKQVWLAGPLVCVSLLQFCLQLVSVMFVGHLGELALAGASIATSFASVTGFSLLMGMASALDTFCGQSYGAKQYHMLGIHMQRAILILMLVSIPLAVIWLNTGSILEALGQDPDISREAGLYARFMIPSIFAYGILQCQVKFLQTQNIVIPMMLSSGVTTLLHVLVCWILVFKSPLGNEGAALANSISYSINVLLLAIYIKFSSSCAKTWTGFSREALHGISTFLKLAIPSAVMVCLEMWSFEMMVLLSGLLPNPELETSVLSISLNTAATVWMISFGLSGAVSTRVSNELGAGHPQAARLAVIVVLVIGITQGSLLGLVMVFIRNVWGYAYSNEVEVVRYVAGMMPILAVSNFVDGLQCVLSGFPTLCSHQIPFNSLTPTSTISVCVSAHELILLYILTPGSVRGCGWQKIGAFINLGAYYLVGIPCAALFAFILHIGGKGLWLGILCALVVQVSLLFFITIRTNWEAEAKKAKDRVFDSAIPVDVVS